MTALTEKGEKALIEMMKAPEKIKLMGVGTKRVGTKKVLSEDPFTIEMIPSSWLKVRVDNYRIKIVYLQIMNDLGADDEDYELRIER